MTNMNKHLDPCVYALHGDDGQIAYVGSTSKNATNRRWEHVYRARSGHSAPVYEWMREVGIDSVGVVVIAREPDPVLREALEVSSIVQLIEEGHPLVNQMSRDGRPGSMSQETKRRVGTANAGRATWIKGKRGEAAGWTAERRAAQSRRFRDQAA